jgi:ribosomal protein S18 acetylase RimI-like enzyme
MGVAIRSFEPTGPDLAAACRLWNEAVAPESELYLRMTPELLGERLIAADGGAADICLFAEVGGELVGMAVGTTDPLVEQDVANLACVAVVPEARRQGVGSVLLAAVEGRARNAGRARLQVDYATRIRLAHGVDPVAPGHLWLLHKGFRVSREQLFMRQELVGWRMPEGIRKLVRELERGGVELRMAEEPDLPALLAMAARFGDFTAAALAAAVGDPGGAPVLIAVAAKRVVGFVGPLTVTGCGFADFCLIAVAEAERGRGIGKALYYLALSNFRERGACMLELMTGTTNPAQKLYLDAGMHMVGLLVCHDKRLRSSDMQGEDPHD